MTKMGKYRDPKKRHNYIIDYMQKSNEACRLICIYYYSEGLNVCACCKESHYEFLCIDHLKKPKNQHRSGRELYVWLIRNNFPVGFRVLCHNCNMSIGFYGNCPHSYTCQLQP